MPKGRKRVPAQPSAPGPAPAEPAAAADQDARPAPAPGRDFPVVGIGASAGGLAAFEAFFSAMPADGKTNMAFVLVQHLAPDHKSILKDLVKRYTSMQVFEVEDGMDVRPDCAYIIPPNRDMAYLNGTLQLLAPAAPRGLRLPIDFFFRSLAQDQRERAIGIVLSGTGSDGTLGVRAIKGEGGMVMAQTPETTQYNGMPRSALATGLVDYVLPPAEMPAQLMAYTAHAFGKGLRPAAPPTQQATDTLKKICVVMRAQTGHDFSLYKENTVIRRIDRRMALHQIEQAEEYLSYLRSTPAEATALFRDLLIGVTNFFRDPEAFAALQTRIIPRLFADKPPGGTVRVWVCGCSTGEEAYSMAILILEHLETLKQAFKVQIFATDIDPQAIEQARSGVFPASIASDVAPERLTRYFRQDQSGGLMQVQKTVRDLVIFSEQDVIRDPPFSKLDLISCRNLLIYMGVELQRKLIPLFHYSLNPEGVLFLGTSETVGEFVTLFTAIDRKQKIYLRRQDLAGAPRPLLGDFVPPLFAAVIPQRPFRGPGGDEVKADLRHLTERALLRHYTPTAVLVNRQGETLHIYGRTGKYLEPAPGDAGVQILSMAREGLRRELTTALHQAVTQKEVIRRPGLRVKTNGEFAAVDLTILPVSAGPGFSAALSDLFLVLLEESRSPDQDPAGKGAAMAETADNLEIDRRIAQLEQDLRAKEEHLQTALEEMETSNEELKSTNEEMQSVNEELQSTNEELETSKEELQSVNEELNTVNAELQTKVVDLSRANNDMNNLLAGTGIATLFVDHQLRITRFTPTTTQVINLIPTDIDRPVGHIVSNLVGYDRLVEDVRAVLETLAPRETEVRTKDGRFFLMRIRPYRTLENVIEGAVIAFVEITDRYHAQEALRVSRERLAADLEAMTRLQKLGALFVNESSRQGVLEEIVEAALTITRAELGELRLLESRPVALEQPPPAPAVVNFQIVAQRGFKPPWLDYWAGAPRGPEICARVLGLGERVIVEDIALSAILAGTPDLELLTAAGARAILAAPLRGRTGRMIGVLSIFFKAPQQPDEHTLRLLDLLIRQATDILEREEVEEAKNFAENLVATVREPLLVLTENLRVVAANEAFYRVFRTERNRTVGHPLYELGDRQWEIPQLRRLLEEVLPQNAEIKDYRVRQEFEGVGPRTLLLNARRSQGAAGRPALILLAIEDVTGREAK